MSVDAFRLVSFHVLSFETMSPEWVLEPQHAYSQRAFYLVSLVQLLFTSFASFIYSCKTGTSSVAESLFCVTQCLTVGYLVFVWGKCIDVTTKH
jgi:hypothetical protein